MDVIVSMICRQADYKVCKKLWSWGAKCKQRCVLPGCKNETTEDILQVARLQLKRVPGVRSQEVFDVMSNSPFVSQVKTRQFRRRKKLFNNTVNDLIDTQHLFNFWWLIDRRSLTFGIGGGGGYLLDKRHFFERGHQLDNFLQSLRVFSCTLSIKSDCSTF